MERNTFRTDSNFEKVSLQFLREKTDLYSKLNIAEEIHDRQRQLKGIDLLTENGKKIDVKSVASITLPTFCMELKNQSSGKLGWFINPEVETEWYLLTYHELVGGTNDYAKDKDNVTIDRIGKTHCILISKEQLRKIVSDEINCPMEYLTETLNRIAKYITKHYDDIYSKRTYVAVNRKLIRDDNSHADVKFVQTAYSSHREMPLNIVIRRTLLDRYAERVWDY